MKLFKRASVFIGREGTQHGNSIADFFNVLWRRISSPASASRRMSCLLIACTVFATTLAFGQGGSYPLPSVVMGNNISLLSAFNGLYSQPLPLGGVASGRLIVTYSNISGSPATCSWILFPGGSTATSAALGNQLNTPTFTPSNGVAQYRIPTSISTALYPAAAVSLGWSCATFPTTGSAIVEFIPDNSALPSFFFTHITTNTSTAVVGAGLIHAININNPGGTETVTVYANSSCTGTQIAIITPTVTTSFILDVNSAAGFCVVTAGTTAGDTTVVWR